MGISSYQRSLTLAAASVNNVCQSQSGTAGTALTLNGSAVTAGVATFDTQRQVLFTFAANETGHNFTLTGTNSDGTSQTETVLGTATTAVSLLNYLTVTSIISVSTTTGALQVGTNGVGATPWLMIDTFRDPVNIGIQVVVSGSVTYTVQYTTEIFWNLPVVINTAFNHATLVAQTASNSGSILVPVTGIRLQVTAGTGTATMTYSQAGP